MQVILVYLLAYSISPHVIKVRSAKSHCVEEISPQQLPIFEAKQYFNGICSMIICNTEIKTDLANKRNWW